MFEQMRQNTKTVIWITVIAFVGLIFLAWGADFQLGGNQMVDPSQIGSVNGEPIAAREYEAAVAQARAMYQEQSGRDLDERTDVFVRNQTWDQLVQDVLLRQEARKRGIRVTDEEVVQAVLNQPPPELVQHPSFMTNGQFDLGKYQSYLRQPGVDTRGLEAQYRMTLPVQKLQMQVVASVAVSDVELWDAYRMQNEKARVSYVMLPSGAFEVDPQTVSNETLESHYAANREAYKRPAQASIQYVQVARTHTEADSLNLIAQAEQVLTELREGEEFDVLVDAYSEAPPSMRGGETGTFVSANQIPDVEIREKAFQLPIGEVSGIIPTRTGLHIIKVEERQDTPTGTQVKLADIYLPLTPSIDTLTQLREDVYRFRQEVEERDFSEVAGEMGLTVRETPPFSETGFIPGLGALPQVQEFAFSRPVGSISAPVERAEGWVVARLKERREPGIPDLNEVRDRVRADAADSLRLDRALAAARPLLERARAGEALPNLAEASPEATYGTTEPFGRLGFPQGIGGDPQVIGSVFAADIGLIPEVLRGRTGAFIVLVDEKMAAEREAFEAQKEQQRRSVLQRRQSQLYGDWLADLRRDAEIEDYRFGRYDI